MKEIRRILKEETAIPENIDKAMEDVLSGILNSPDEKTTGALSKKTNGERTKNSGNKKKIIRILLPVAAILGVSTGVLATNIGLTGRRNYSCKKVRKQRKISQAP